jgi:proteic killer suppression protein
MEAITKVFVSVFAEKQIAKLPSYIKESLRDWMEVVQFVGIRYTRQFRGYNDEPLKGKRRGQRSVRLNRAYRVIYIEINNNLEILIIEVNKHDY